MLTFLFSPRISPEEEKKYWHSHKYEVESGLLMLLGKALVPSEFLWLDSD